MMYSSDVFLIKDGNFVEDIDYEQTGEAACKLTIHSGLKELNQFLFTMNVNFTNLISSAVATSLIRNHHTSVCKLQTCTERKHVVINFSHPHVRSRLEKLMGSNIVRLTDREYMQKLQERIYEDHLEMQRRRIKEREGICYYSAPVCCLGNDNATTMHSVSSIGNDNATTALLTDERVLFNGKMWRVHMCE
ncbi:hypothetical protein C0J52_17855 [Blattella germanica]|nr:hypothetical protein C0J52_17855 [Blattella germanica]